MSLFSSVRNLAANQAEVWCWTYRHDLSLLNVKLERITVHLGEQIIKAQWPVWTVRNGWEKHYWTYTWQRICFLLKWWGPFVVLLQIRLPAVDYYVTSDCLNINIQNFFSFVLMCWSFCVSALVAEYERKEAAKARRRHPRGYVNLYCECPGLFCVPCPACVEFWSHPYFRPNRCSDYSYAYIESLLARPMAPPPPPQPVPQPAVVAPPRPLPRRSGRVRREPCRYQSVDFRAWVFCSIFFSVCF